MALYLIGDIQGCDDALQQLLDKISFSPSRDCLYLLGDLVNRGPDSLAVLRRMVAWGTAARCLLGNHDLHLLAVAHGVRAVHRNDTLSAVLAAPERGMLLDWLRHQPMAILEKLNGHEVLMRRRERTSRPIFSRRSISLSRCAGSTTTPLPM